MSQSELSPELSGKTSEFNCVMVLAQNLQRIGKGLPLPCKYRRAILTTVKSLEKGRCQ